MATDDEFHPSSGQTTWAQNPRAFDHKPTLNVPDELDAPVEQIAVEAEPPLSDEQEAVLRQVMNGESVFFTGSAGVGKSVLTRAIIRNLRQMYPEKDAVAVTATTGIAATNIGGCTLHSWAGIGLGKGKSDKLYWRVYLPIAGLVVRREKLTPFTAGKS